MNGYDMRNMEDVDRSVVGNYSTILFTDVAVKIIKDHNEEEEPLFLYLPYQAVHGPQMAPQEYIDKFSYIKDMKRRIYAGYYTCHRLYNVYLFLFQIIT